MPQVLLIQPPIQDFYLTAKRTVPYGLACIAGALKDQGYTVEILDALATAKARHRPWPKEMDHLKPYYGRPDQSPFALFHHYRHFGYSYAYLAEAIRRSAAAVVGIASLFSAYSDQAHKMAAIARRVLPRAAIVLGGHHPTAQPETVMADPNVDYVLRGEGEVALPALVRALKGEGLLEEVPGLVYRRQDGTLQINAPAWVNDLDRLPPPAEELVKTKFYSRATGPGKVMVTSRGCPLGCSYCCLSHHSPVPYRRRKLVSLVREMDAAITRQVPGFIDFEDENLTFHKPWFLDFMAQLRTRINPGEVELRAMNGLFPPSLDKEMIASMAASGFKALNLALATTHGPQLQRFGRPDVRSSLEDVWKWSREFGLASVTYLIAGAPRQTAASSLADLLYLAGRPTLIGLSVFYPAPGSRDYGLCKQLDLLPENASLLRSTALPVAHRTSRREVVTLLRLARILNFIKHLTAQGVALPHPSRPAARIDLARLDREAAGRRLLSWLRYDGCIRGITPDGEVYRHHIAPHLVREFVEAVFR